MTIEALKVKIGLGATRRRSDATVLGTARTHAEGQEVQRTLNGYNTDAATPIGIMVLSVVIAALVSWGAVYGGALVYGFNVETAGDSPVWHRSEADVLPGDGY